MCTKDVFILVPSVLVDNSSLRKPVDFTGKVFYSQKNGHSIFGRFRRPQLENEVFKPRCHQENKSEGESLQSLRSLPAHEEGCHNI